MLPQRRLPRMGRHYRCRRRRQRRFVHRRSGLPSARARPLGTGRVSSAGRLSVLPGGNARLYRPRADQHGGAEMLTGGRIPAATAVPGTRPRDDAARLGP